MSYRIFGGVHDILSNIDDLKALGPNQREKGQIIAVKDGDYRVYIWDPTATAKDLLCSLAGEDPVNTPWPSKARTWYPEMTPSTFEERVHMVEQDNVRFDPVTGAAVREDFGYLFVVPNDISGGTQGTNDYTNTAGRWVVMNYATLIDNIPWDLRGGHLIPRYNNKFDFGNAEHKVRDFYLSDATMWLGDEHKISISQAGDLRFQKRKTGKIPEFLDSHASSSHGSQGQGNKRILEIIRDNPNVSSAAVDALPFIDESTSIPTHLNLKIGEWIQVAKEAGFNQDNPAELFGESDFEDALSLGGGNSSGGTIDPSNIGGYDLGDLTGRLGDLEGKFIGGILAGAHIDTSILRVADFTSKFAEHIGNETDLVRNGGFGALFDTHVSAKDILSQVDFDTNWDSKFNTEFDARLGTKGPGDLLGMDLYISAHADVMKGVAARAFFDGGGNLNQSNGGTWSAAKTYVDSAVSALSATDLGIDTSNYATVTDLTNGLAGKLNSADLPDTSDFVTNGVMNTYVAGQIAGLASSADINNAINGLGIGDVTGLQAQLDTYATSTALSALDTRVTSAEGTIGSNTARITGNTTSIAGKQDIGDYLTTSSTIGADKITGTLAADRIPNLNASKITAGTLSASRISSTITRNSQLSSYATTAALGVLDTRLGTAEGSITTNATNIGVNSANLLTTDTALFNLYDKAVTTGSTALSYNSPLNLDGTKTTDKFTLQNVAADKLTGTISSDRIPTLSQSKITGLTDSLSALNTSGSGGLTLVNNDWMFITSDKDLKNIIRVVPQGEITTDYHLIGLITVEYEWNQTAADLFGLSGHVAEGFVAEQLEQLYPAPDPQNPPTSKEDGHIWWHEYMSDAQKALSSDVHNYYTFFNSEMLQAEIDSAIANL